MLNDLIASWKCSSVYVCINLFLLAPSNICLLNTFLFVRKIPSRDECRTTTGMFENLESDQCNKCPSYLDFTYLEFDSY